MSFRVPEGISSAQAFNALYRNAKITNPYVDIRYAGQPALHYLSANVAQIFHAYCPHFYCKEVRGKLMEVDFSRFPDLNVEGYDKRYGKGAAACVISNAENDSLEPLNLLVDRCSYFSKEWRAKTPNSSQEDLQEMFTACQQLQLADQAIEEQLNKPSIMRPWLTRCQAQYTLEQAGRPSVERQVSCQEASDELESLVHQGKINAQVSQFSSCLQNPHLPFMQSCIVQRGILSALSAKKAIDAQKAVIT